MRFRGRVTGLALAALAAFAAISATGCASSRETTVTNRAATAQADAAGVPAAREAGAPAELTGLTLIPDGEAPRLLLSGSSGLSPTVFAREDGKKVVIDFPNTVASPGLEPPRPLRGGESVIDRVTMRSFTELGEPHVQVELSGAAAIDPKLLSEAGSSALAVVLAAKAAEAPPAPPATAESMASAAAPAQPEPIRVETLAIAPTTSEPPAVAAAAAAPAPSPVADREHLVQGEAAGKPASRLAAVRATRERDVTRVRLTGDGTFGFEAFLLENPPRWVVDLKGVKNAGAAKSQDVATSPVTKLRVSQFRAEPEPVTRVVLDLDRKAVPEVVSDEKGLSVVFRKEPVATVASKGTISITRSADRPAEPPAAAQPAAGSFESHESEDTSEPVVPVPVPAAAAAVAAPPPAEPAPAPAAVPAKSEAPTAPVAVAQAAPAPVRGVEPVASPAAAAPEIVAAPQEVRPVEPVAPPAPRPAPRRSATAEDRALVEAAEALLLQQDSGGQTRDLGNPYEARVIGSGEKQYTGEPITLNLKDADVKDTLQKFSELTGLNIVLDPEVRGTVTVSLTDIPWDQALELILKINGLGYVLEGNVMRIASTAKLASEEASKQALSKAQEANRPVKTVIQKLSYARGAQLVQAIKNVMTPRGDAFVEARTNSLIIKELPENIPVVLDLIKNLDTPPQQVMIEARVVEATRTFSRQFGIDWSFRSVNDAAHGNTTGLVFPNTVAMGGRVALPSGSNLLALSMANVLDSFGIDVALSAAEARGLLKVVSSPKVQTAQLVQASIQSGFQIPVQTTVNNTTSVLYVDATLRLDVLPYITAEGTIVMDITIQKREPAVGINVAIGQNIPLVTRDAKTSLLVRDGGTAVIGGIMKLSVNNQRNMIPGLWKIPLLGNLFRNNNDREDTDELMIFITPRIMKNS